MLVHIFNSSTQKAEAARAVTKRNPVSKKPPKFLGPNENEKKSTKKPLGHIGKPYKENL